MVNAIVQAVQVGIGGSSMGNFMLWMSAFGVLNAAPAVMIVQVEALLVLGMF